MQKGIRLVELDERLTFEHAGSRIYYRRVPMDVRRTIITKNTERGVLNGPAFTKAMLEWAVIGWDGILNKDGEAVPYRLDLVERLPDTIQEKLVELVGAAAEIEAAAEKNSPST